MLMKPESKIYDKIKEYLQSLGYSFGSIDTIDDSKSQSVDIIVKDHGRVLVAIDIKTTTPLSKLIPKEQVGFHPVTRQLQSEAESIGAPYYLVSNGVDHFWLRTQKNGRPGLEEEIPFSRFNDKELENPQAINSVLDHIHTFIKEQPLSGDSLFDFSLVLYNRVLQEKRGQFDYLIDLVPILGSNYDRQRKVLEYKLEKLLRFLAEKNISLLSNRDNVLYYIDKLFLTHRMEWSVPRWLANLMVKLLPYLHEMEIVDLFSRNGTILSAAQLNGYNRVHSFCSSQRDLYWLKVQQLLTTDSPEPPEIIFNSDNQFFTERSCYSYQPDAFLLAPAFEMKVASDSGGMRKGISVMLERALNMVSHNGYVICIVPESFLFSSQDKLIRQQIGPYLKSIISLPSDTFRPYSAVKTNLLILKKEGWDKEQEEVLFGNIESVPEQNLFLDAAPPGVKEIISCLRAFELKEPILQTDTVFTVKRLQIENFQLSNYKKSRARSVNEGFTLVPLKDLVSIIKRGNTIKQDKEGSIPFISPAVIRSFELRDDSILYTSVNGLGKTPRRAKMGDILFNIIGTYCGNAALVTEEFDDMPINTHVIALTPNLAVVHAGYLTVALNSNIVQEQFQRLQANSVISALGLRSINEVMIPITTVEKQQDIYNQYTCHATKINSVKVQLSLLENKLNSYLRDFAIDKEDHL